MTPAASAVAPQVAAATQTVTATGTTQAARVRPAAPMMPRTVPVIVPAVLTVTAAAPLVIVTAPARPRVAPAGIRTTGLMTGRSGGHCEWAGGCWQPAAACHVHHVIRKADGGTTSVKDCALLCSFHHLVAVHRWGWKLIVNPDGTTTAWSPDGGMILHSHGPPPRPG